ERGDERSPTTLRPISIFWKTSGATASEDITAVRPALLDRECGYSANVRYWGNSVHFWILARAGLSAFDPKRTSCSPRTEWLRCHVLVGELVYFLFTTNLYLL